MRLAGCLLPVVVVLMVVSCGGDDVEDEATRAVQAVQEWVGDTPGAFAGVGEDYGCILYSGGPAEAVRRPIVATCRYDAERQGEAWVVTYTTSWSCRDFAGAVQGYDRCEEVGSFTRSYRVVGSSVKRLGERGAFPPYLAE